MKKIFKRIGDKKWKQMWAGNWNMLNASDWGEHYLTDLRFRNELFLHQILFLFKDGKISAWAVEEDINNFSDRLSKYFRNDIKKIKTLAKDLERKAKASLEFMSQNRNSIDLKIYNKYLKLIRDKYIPNVVAKYAVDSFNQDNLKRFLPILQKARVIAEPVFDMTLDFDKQLAISIAKEKKVKDYNILLYMMKSELLRYFQTNKLPKLQELKKRQKQSALVFFESDKPYLLVGSEAKKVESLVTKVKNITELKGNSAYPGKVIGSVKIVVDPKKPGKFNEGDILITSMTRPDFIHLIKKSSAIVTESGGILSHAAIVAREIKKPCIIGTMVATKVFKDGDRVEVDATKGVVRKI